ncbi:MAG: B12-binding domain-containing radical SAM protein [Proteobacteria bacterium]|nr:B12-binding domain-containing radical SAM protein [Pseudomonadota bacterium]MBU4101050.1 B12-binding domain-containing radical SAM protein [Pseudomonadota bacterium]MBU4127265.1 B12-binding domain-containing radical SAM protein [Pseudomonadota bacterium]
MASVFLANAPYFLEERYGKLAAVGSTLPHMGLLMLGAVLRKSGHRVRMVDASALGLTYEETIEEIKKNQPDIIGLTAVTPSIDRTVKLAYMIKRIYPFVPIVIGGPHFTAVPQKTMKDYPVFDYGVIGEGEHTIVDLVETLASGRTPSTVPGVAIRENGKIFFSPPRAPVKDIDALPFPAWDLLDGFPHNYHPALFKYKRLPSTHIISSRGCPSKCIFCDTSVFSRRIRFHSPEYILELVDYLVKKFNIKEIIFEDDQFLLKKKRVEKICEGILRSKWNITWSCSGRVNSVNDLKFLKLMKHSGCWQINYGIESGNQRILDFAKKEITIDQIEKAVRLTHKAGILSKGYFIFGLPYETEDTMQNTIEFAKSIPLDDISIFMLTPFPGSEMYDIAEQHGRIDKDFEKMNLLDVVYVPNGLSKEILLNYQRSFMKEFYLRPRIIGNYLKRLMVNPLNLFNMIKAFSGFLNSVFGKTTGH